jgi:predicted dienelactone hydrolase
MVRLVLLSALLGCSPTPAANAAGADAPRGDAGDPLLWALGEAGPHRVGYRSFEHTYRPAGQTVDRTITIHLWYPTDEVNGVFPRYGGLFVDRRASTDAAPAPPSRERYPLHVYSHGHRGFAGTAHFLHRHLASHGWVTAAPDHTLNTLADAVEPRPIAIYYLRSLDVAQAVDALDALPAADPLAGSVDTSRVLLTGHSFGAHTVWSSAGATFDAASIEATECTMVPCTPAELDVFRSGLGDPRFVAAAPMAGVLDVRFFGADGHASVAIPILAMSGGADPIGADAQFAAISGIDFTWVDVAGACHEFFALGCGDPAGEQEAIVGALVLALGRRHVLGDTSPGTLGVLDGTIPLSPRVTLMRR